MGNSKSKKSSNNDRKTYSTKTYYDTTSYKINPSSQSLSYKPPITQIVNLPKIACDLKLATDQYTKFVSYIELQRTFDFLVFPNKISLIDNYIRLFPSIKGNNSPVFDNYDLECIYIIHKLHPTEYRKHVDHNIPIHSSWLLKVMNIQLDTCIKMFNIKSGLDLSDWTDKYKKFLKMIKENIGTTIVPTLEQDFMWHSHMIDNQSYIIDCQRYYGYVLKHDDDISEERLKLYSKYTEVLKANPWQFKEKPQINKDKPKPNSDFLVATSIIPSYSDYHNSYITPDSGGDDGQYTPCDGGDNGHHSSCGGSGCGASCGGGGGGCGGD